MKIYRDLSQIEKRDCVLTIGTFDGVHLGHQTILRRLCDEARRTGTCSTVLTFEPHPQFILKPERKPELKLLTTLDEKVKILENSGIDRLIVMPFTLELSRYSSKKFIEKILLEKIGFRTIIIGYDHSFGKNREGDIRTLRTLADKFGFSIIQMPPFQIGDTTISSTKIRKLISEGNMQEAAKFLGRNYQIGGKIVKGEGRGHKINIPTANLKPFSNQKLIPPDGIYASKAFLKNESFNSVVYIGTKPTFNFEKRVIEAHLFNFSGELYGREMVIEFVSKIRDDRKFDSTENLIMQIEQDKENSLKILNNVQ